jgi:acyl-CoA thioester hydrolase
MKIRQEMINQDNKICSTAEFTVAVFDLKTRKIIEPTERWIKAIGL